MSTGRESTQFLLRLPDGMRERIRAAAEANGRSMNAEIVGALTKAYPPSETALDLLADLHNIIVGNSSKIRQDDMAVIHETLDALGAEIGRLQSIRALSVPAALEAYPDRDKAISGLEAVIASKLGLIEYAKDLASNQREDPAAFARMEKVIAGFEEELKEVREQLAAVRSGDLSGAIVSEDQKRTSLLRRLATVGFGSKKVRDDLLHGRDPRSLTSAEHETLARSLMDAANALMSDTGTHIGPGAAARQSARASSPLPDPSDLRDIQPPRKRST